MGQEIRPNGLTQTHMYIANVGQDYWACDFANYEGPREPMRVTHKYLRELETMKGQGVGLLYVGPPGPGKTTLMMITAKYLTRARWKVFCTSLGEIVETIQKSWKDEGQASLIERCRQADFLFIDDIGKEHRGQSGFVQTIFDNLVRYRIQHRLPVFLTTNFTKSELEGTYGESVMSLLEGKLLPVTVDGDDYRRTKLKQYNRETLQ